MDPNTPICPTCGDKFPGDPCKGCAKAEYRRRQVREVKQRNYVKRRRRPHGRR